MKRAMVIAAIAAAVLLGGCGEMPFFRSGAALGRLTFATGDGAARAATLAGSTALSSSRAAAMTTDPVMDYVSDFYPGYGTLVGKYTPSNVVLPIELGEILLNDDGNPVGNIFIRIPPDDTNDDPDLFVADFAFPIDSGFTSLPQGVYDRLELRFTGGHSLHTLRGDPFRQDYTVWTENKITVDIPGYGAQLSDIASRMPDAISGGDFTWSKSAGSEAGPDAEDPEVFAPEPGRYFERRNPAGDTFDFTLQYLYPRETPATQKYRQADDALWYGWHVFTSTVTAARTARDRELDYNTDTLLMPLAPIEISPLSGKATIVVSLDTTDLIEVYDNGTPVDETDDIVVLADKYWERFSVSIVYGD